MQDVNMSEQDKIPWRMKHISVSLFWGWRSLYGNNQEIILWKIIIWKNPNEVFDPLSMIRFCPVISPSSYWLLLFNVLLNYALTSLNFLLNFKHSKVICILSSSSFLLSVRSSSPQIPNATPFLHGHQM